MKRSLKGYADDEREIWIATYAAAFAAEFQVEWKIRGLDDAVKGSVGNAEMAWIVADQAVLTFREWRAVERNDQGPDALMEGS